MSPPLELAGIFCPIQWGCYGLKISAEMRIAGVVPLFSTQCTGVLVLVKRHSGAILLCVAAKVVNDGPLDDVVGGWAVLVFMQAQYAAGFDSDEEHP